MVIETARVFVDFVQDDAREIVFLLQDVEPHTAGSLHAAFGIFCGGFEECFERFRFDMDELEE